VSDGNKQNRFWTFVNLVAVFCTISGLSWWSLTHRDQSGEFFAATMAKLNEIAVGLNLRQKPSAPPQADIATATPSPQGKFIAMSALTSGQADVTLSRSLDTRIVPGYPNSFHVALKIESLQGARKVFALAGLPGWTVSSGSRTMVRTPALSSTRTYPISSVPFIQR
jgi:hypothetical protein